MKSWMPKKKTLVLVALFLLIGISAYVLGLYLVTSKIGEIKNVYTQSESVVAQEEKVRVIARVANENADKIEALRAYFIAPGDEVGFIEKIEAIAKRSKLDFEIESISQSKPAADSIKEDLTLRISIAGSWQGVMGFVNGLETLPFGVSIISVRIDSTESGIWDGLLELMVFREK